MMIQYRYSSSVRQNYPSPSIMTVTFCDKTRSHKSNFISHLHWRKWWCFLCDWPSSSWCIHQLRSPRCKNSVNFAVLHNFRLPSTRLLQHLSKPTGKPRESTVAHSTRMTTGWIIDPMIDSWDSFSAQRTLGSFVSCQQQLDSLWERLPLWFFGMLCWWKDMSIFQGCTMLRSCLIYNWWNYHMSPLRFLLRH